MRAEGGASHLRLRSSLRRPRRQDELKRRPRPGIVGGGHPSAMGLDDRAADRQSHAHAARLGGEEGPEQTVRVLRVDAGSGVDDLDRHLIGLNRLRSDQQLALPLGDRRHGLNGVDRQIDDDLLELDPIADHWRQG